MNPSSSKVARRFSSSAQFHELVSSISEEIGAEARMEEAEDNVRIEFHRDGRKVGLFRASTVNTSGYVWDNLVPEDCKASWQKLGEPSFWVVRSAEWFDPSLRGSGLGLRAYTALLSYVKAKGGEVVGPDSCAGENTSASAEKVWKKLRTRYRFEGPLLLV